MNDLDTLRTEIDDIDARLLQLLARRRDVSREIGTLKRQSDREVFDPKREQVLLQRLQNRVVELGLPADLILAIWNEILRDSKAQQYES